MYKILALENWELERNRFALEETDKCYYYMTYDSWSSIFDNEQKQIVSNLKISPQDIRKNPLREKYKTKSIATISEWLIQTIKKHPELTNFLWIPAPPSKAPGDENHDNRLVRILELVSAAIPEFIFFDALYVKKSVDESHKTNERDVQKKLQNLGIDESFINKLKNKSVVIFDDVLTTGTTFKTAQIKIHQIDNALKVIGIFIAKAIATSNDIM
ncbi:hypothetical protein FOLKNPGA_03369 [Legionella sp. PC1000]|uniref:phosphoribosyltransferase n=1 Tax=Legionella sp. PC1000 TaxID=2746060 RepID=UPI0015FDDF84|nr:phosphoribosyltransferase [Legionella sp. PC1000]QLZ70555.1 hypothetical protein FOLKNPGA_03369 [Legionella sp. PC1000]